MVAPGGLRKGLSGRLRASDDAFHLSAALGQFTVAYDLLAGILGIFAYLAHGRG